MATQQVSPEAQQQAPAKEAESIPVHKPVKDQSTDKPAKQPVKKKHKKKSYDLLLALIIVLILVGGMVYALLESNRASFESKKETYDQQLAQSKQTIDLTQEQIDAINIGFVDREGVVAFIQEMEASEKYFRTLNLQFNSDEPQSISGVRQLPFTMTISGTIQDVNEYVDALIGSEYVIGISSFVTTSEDGYTEEMTIKVEGNLYISEDYK